MDRISMAAVPAIVSRWTPDTDALDSNEPIRVFVDLDVPQVALEIEGLGIYLTGSEAEILETAIRVARQTFRRR